MGKRGAKKKSWQEHVMKKIVNVGDHMVWTGRYDRNERAVYSLIDEGSRAVVRLMFHIINGQKPSTGTTFTRVCDEARCVNPGCYRLTESNPLPNAERDAVIVELYRKHIKYKQYHMAAIGRKVGLTRERVRQIIEEAHRKVSKA